MCISIFVYTPETVENEIEQFGIDKDKVETPTAKGD